MSRIDFALWSPTEATFWQDWTTAGIVTEPYQFTPSYPGIIISDQTKQGWVPTRATGQLDQDGRPIMEAVPGWHANVRIEGPLVDQFTAGLPQTDAQGKLLPLFQRTHATAFFGLTQQPADATTGFPAGMRSKTGVHYCDPTTFKSPSNVWAD